ncbi:MAG: hypothetical protein ACI8W8_000966 [Rhodothermales bacterium]|jgi:hypothetical protein
MKRAHLLLACFLFCQLAIARTPQERQRDAKLMLDSGLAKLAKTANPRAVANELASAAMRLDTKWGLDFLRQISARLAKTMPEADESLGVYEHLAALATPYDRSLRDRYLGRANVELALQEERAVDAYPHARDDHTRDWLRWLRKRARIRRSVIDILLTPQPHHDRLIHLQRLAQDSRSVTRGVLPGGALHNSGEVEVMDALFRYDIDLMLAVGSAQDDPGFHRYVADLLETQPPAPTRRPLVQFLRHAQTHDWVYHFLRERLAIADYEGAINVAKLLPDDDSPFGYGRDASMYRVATHIARRDPGLARRFADGYRAKPYGAVLRRAAAEGWARAYPEAFSQAFPDYASFPHATQLAADEFMRRRDVESALAIAKPVWPRLAVQSRWMAAEDRIVFLQRCLAHERDPQPISIILAELMDSAPNTGMRALQDAYEATPPSERLKLATELGRHPWALQAFYAAIANNLTVRAPEHLDSLAASDGQFAHILASNLPNPQLALSRVAAGLARHNLAAAESLLAQLPPALQSPQPLWVNLLTANPSHTDVVTKDRPAVFTAAALENWSETSRLDGIHQLIASLPRSERNDIGSRIVLALLDRGAIEDAEALIERIDDAPFIRAASALAPALNAG